MKHITGVYIILNTLNNKYYIGSSTKSINRRFQSHRASLIRGDHENARLQNSVNKHGIDNFSFEILEEYPAELCRYMEQFWMNMLDSANSKYGYNICSVATNTFGTKRTPEQCNNISKSLIGKMSGNKHPMWGIKREPTYEKKCCRMGVITAEILKEYKSVREAAKDMKVDDTSISKACHGKTKICKGYKWKYL